jgi:hypothetical protein
MGRSIQIFSYFSAAVAPAGVSTTVAPAGVSAAVAPVGTHPVQLSWPFQVNNEHIVKTIMTNN